MTLKNMPFRNAKPRNHGEMKAYVKALNLKRSADGIGEALLKRNDKSQDLDPSPHGMALQEDWIDLGHMGKGDIVGTASTNDKSEVTHMRAEIDDNSSLDGKFSYRADGDIQRYTYQKEYTKVVDRLVHDTATDTINFFQRDEKGHFLAK